jgi:hypothetical protein
VPKSWVTSFALLVIFLQSRVSAAGVMVWSIIHTCWMNADGVYSNYAVESGENGTTPCGSLLGVASIAVVPKKLVELYM